MNIVIKIFLGIILSFYLFPIGFTFLPASLNTKMILSVLGLVFFINDNLRLSELKLNVSLLISIILACLFSGICFYSIEYNNTDDYTYVTYIGSFFVWLLGAYSVSWFFRYYYDEFSFRQLAFYALAVCAIQCILALMIDHIPVLKTLVDGVVQQGQDFLNEVDRLYGIGASLDSAGVRFTVVLLIAVNLLIKDNYVRNNLRIYFLVLLAFFIVSIVGNMISRTTSIGVGIGLTYIIFSSNILSSVVQVKTFKIRFLFLLVLIGIILLSVYIYQTSEEYRNTFRFAFEGFFNWYETGEWTTGSTEKLNENMWIWPEDTETWMIGSGYFGFFIYSTDIGYCRFILYCGLIGFSVFALLFVFNALAFMIKVPQYRMLFLMLLLVPFIIWVKVATDIFFIYAIFYCIDSFSITDNTLRIKTNEDSI